MDDKEASITTKSQASKQQHIYGNSSSPSLVCQLIFIPARHQPHSHILSSTTYSSVFCMILISPLHVTLLPFPPIAVTPLTLLFHVISQLQELRKLRALPNLTYLTVAGNPASDLPHHRLYLIFHIRTLDVLDGRRITSDERDEAARRFDQGFLLELLNVQDIACVYRSILSTMSHWLRSSIVNM